MSCATVDGCRPPWEVLFYVGDSEREGLVRCDEYSIEDPELCLKWDIIKGDDPRINEGAWITFSAIEALEKEVLSACEKWQGDCDSLQNSFNRVHIKSIPGKKEERKVKKGRY